MNAGRISVVISGPDRALQMQGSLRSSKLLFLLLLLINVCVLALEDSSPLYVRRLLRGAVALIGLVRRGPAL
jgi:hypothetical protein